MVLKSNLERLLFVCAVFVITMGILFPFGDAKADNVVSKSGALSVNAGDPLGVVNQYKVLATGTNQGDPQNGCNPSTVSVAIAPVVPAGITVNPLSRIFVSCNVFLPYTFTADKTMPPGDYVIDVLATPVSATNGMYQTNPATFKLTVVVPVEIKIDTINSNPTIWGIPVSIAGTASGFGNTDKVNVDCGDGKSSNGNSIEGITGGWTASCTYSNPGGYVITANLVSSSNVLKATTTAPITVTKRGTTINLDVIEDILNGERFLVSGDLTDEQGIGVSGRVVTFTGDGGTVLPSTATGRLEVKDLSGVEITGGTMRLNSGAEIGIGYKSTLVRLLITDMGSNTFDVEVTRGDGSTINNSGLSGNNYFTIGHTSGISKIKILNVSSGKVGISEIQTNSLLVGDRSIRTINSFSASSSGATSIILADGIFSSEGTSSTTIKPSNIDPNKWNVNAQFTNVSDPLYKPSLIDNKKYATIETLSGGGIGGAAPSGDVELGITSVVCTADADNDALCDSWEGAGNGVPYLVRGQALKYNLPGTNPNFKDLLYEVDYMAGHAMDPLAKADVVSLFNNLNPPIKLQFFEDETLTHKDVINVWKDSDTDNTNDFEGIKASRYGTAAEHPILSGTQTNAFTPMTVTVSGLKITTPAVSTDGRIVLSVKLTTGSISTSTAIPATASITASSALGISGATASVSALSTTSKILTITIPFSSLSTQTQATIPSVTVTLTGVSISAAVTNPGSPTATTTLLDAKAQAIRYMLLAHSSGGRSGAAEIKGNDISITLGVGFGEVNSQHAGTEGTRNEQAGTIAHEIGHNLNLDHGGPANLIGSSTSPISRTDNCKPNHISIMNYARQLPTFLGNNWKLEFGVPLFGNLNENTGLSETTGLKALIPYSYTPTIVYGTPVTTPVIRTAPSATSTAANIGIDWDGNGAIGGTPKVNVNNLGFTGCNIGTATTYQTNDFISYDEAANFDFNFRGASNGQFDGFHNDANDLGSVEVLQQKLGSAIYSLVPPPSPDGTETRKGGSTIQLKFDLTDTSDGTKITYARAYAKYTIDGNTFVTIVPDFTFNGNDGHYALQFTTPKVQKTTILYINYIVDLPGNVEDRLLVDTNNTFVDPKGHKATIELTLTK